MAKYSSRERTRYHVREAKKRNVLNTPNASQSPAVELNPPLKQSQSHGVFTFGITDERILTKAAITSSEVLIRIALLVDLFFLSRGMHPYVTNTSSPPAKDSSPVPTEIWSIMFS